MAQLVERTLGKGEVPSSTLGISTIEKTKALQLSAGLFVFMIINQTVVIIISIYTSQVKDT